MDATQAERNRKELLGIRSRLKLSQKAMAEMLGLTTNSYSRIERERATRPVTQHTIRLARLLLVVGHKRITAAQEAIMQEGGTE